VKVGIGLPSALSPPHGHVVIEWAAAAEEAGFWSVAVIDRLLAPTYDPLTVLAAAAAVTARVELYASVMLTALRPVAMVVPGSRSEHPAPHAAPPAPSAVGLRYSNGR
jgi:alkanesulfonate monooxygenase SsuD/methylene tetrahydromethanopterin reductase-like flavin-dependent oxidoreductase (luciferase family)